MQLFVEFVHFVDILEHVCIFRLFSHTKLYKDFGIRRILSYRSCILLVPWACRVIVHVRIHKLATGKSETRIWISIRQIYDSTILKANYFFYEKLACLLKDKHHLLNVEKKIKITGVPEKFLKSGKKHNQFWCCYQTCIYWTFVFHKSYFIS